MAQYIKVAVIDAELEEEVFRPVPLVDDLFHDVLVVVEIEADWPLVLFSA
jgi:hypothetical protein